MQQQQKSPFSPSVGGYQTFEQYMTQQQQQRQQQQQQQQSPFSPFGQPDVFSPSFLVQRAVSASSLSNSR
jgi:hypothetical protein